MGIGSRWVGQFVGLLALACSTPTQSANAPAQSASQQPEPMTPAQPPAAPVSSAITDPPVDAPVRPGPRVIGYFTNWAQYRKGDCKFTVDHVDAALFTHINYAFAAVDGGDRNNPSFKLAPTDKRDEGDLFVKVNALKQKNPNLKTLISVGGWSFNDPPTAWLFTTMASSAEYRGQFIRHSIKYLREHGFDGIDIDWEYPVAEDRGGKPHDKQNYTKLLSEFRAAMHAEAEHSGKPELLLTVATPAGSHHRQHFELSEIHRSLDWINVMTYDYHGSWEKKTGANAPLEDHEEGIKDSIKAYIDAGVPRAKIVMGFPTYGKTWGGVQKPALDEVATGVGTKGECSQEPGSVTSFDAQALIATGGFKEMWDDRTATPFAYHAKEKVFMTFENEKSYSAKLDFLQQQELGGAMFWAIDLDDFRNGYPLISQVAGRLRGADTSASD